MAEHGVQHTNEGFSSGETHWLPYVIDVSSRVQERLDHFVDPEMGRLEQHHACVIPWSKPKPLVGIPSI
jgi:hypothetical protein